jgi:glycosyltransferase involved in cell wall biosynthesis
VAREELARALSQALCVVLPSRREGYGAIVVEAAALGTPSVVVASPDNAATELIEEGVNGFVAPSAGAGDLAAAILRAHDRGPALRESTGAWFARNVRRLSIDSSLEAVLSAYRGSS